MRETDVGAEVGTDMDLHFVHAKYAVGSGFDGDGDGQDDPWYNQPFDCFWFNKHPNWGTFDPTANDDPSLALDDTDGAGPEVVLLAVPQNGAKYLIGAHYWSDHGLGETRARVRVFIYGAPVHTAEHDLGLRDFWCVVSVDWPSATITPCVDADGEPNVTQAYQNPYFSP